MKDSKPCIELNFGDFTYEKLTKIVIKWYDNYYAAKFTLGVSRDGENWIASSFLTGNSEDFVIDVAAYNLTHPYIALQCHEKNSVALGIKEIELWGYDFPVDNDVYLGGYTRENVDGKYRYSPCIWTKNTEDKAFNRYFLGKTDTVDGIINDVRLIDGKLYSIGTKKDQETNRSYPGYWINREWHELTIDGERVQAFIEEIAQDSNERIYIVGNIINNGAGYWTLDKTGKNEYTRLQSDPTIPGRALTIALNENTGDVYIGGTMDRKPAVWINGEPVKVYLPDEHLPGGHLKGEINKILLNEEGWFAVGDTIRPYFYEDQYFATHWQNGFVKKTEKDLTLPDAVLVDNTLVSVGYALNNSEYPGAHIWINRNRQRIYHSSLKTCSGVGYNSQEGLLYITNKNPALCFTTADGKTFTEIPMPEGYGAPAVYINNKP